MARTVWREYQRSDGEHVIAKRCQCIHGMAVDVVVAIHRDIHCVSIWLNQGEEVGHVVRSRPQLFIESEDVTAPVLSKWIGWEDGINVLELCHQLEIHEIYPPASYAEELAGRLKISALPDWTWFTLGGSGFSLLKDFCSWGEDQSYAVEVSVMAVSIYMTSLADGCRFTEDERLLYIETSFLDAKERLRASSCWEYVEEILNCQRSLRRWLWQFAAYQ